VVRRNQPDLGLVFQIDVAAGTPPPALAPTTALALALATGIELWLQEQGRGDDPLLLALTVATPQTMDLETVRLTFEAPRAILALHPGSLQAALLFESAVRLGRWAVSLVRGASGRVRSAEAAARALATNLRKEREKQEPRFLPLVRLDEVPDAPLPVGQAAGVGLFLHGLMSTDLGTFDGFMRRRLEPNPSDVVSWLDTKSSKLPPAEKLMLVGMRKELPDNAREAMKQAVVFVGWPHDTLTSIDQNASELAGLINNVMGAGAYKIAFVCHSRGGLVARAAVEQLFDMTNGKTWEQRICRCMTFGTPHEGTALAEHPDWRLGTFVLAGLSRKQLAALVDIEAYIEQRGRPEGIKDLQPPSAPGEPFLRKLAKLELKNAPPGARRRLDICATGGVANLTDKGGPLNERLGRLHQAYLSFYTGELEADLVVPLSSATAVNGVSFGRAQSQTTCDHFSYFSDEKCGADAISKAIGLLWESFSLTDIVGPML
jgi:hypothetical protein